MRHVVLVPGPAETLPPTTEAEKFDVMRALVRSARNGTMPRDYDECLGIVERAFEHGIRPRENVVAVVVEVPEP